MKNEITTLQLSPEVYLGRFDPTCYRTASTPDGMCTLGSSNRHLRTLTLLDDVDGWSFVDIHAAHLGLMCQAVRDCSVLLRCLVQVNLISSLLK